MGKNRHLTRNSPSLSLLPILLSALFVLSSINVRAQDAETLDSLQSDLVSRSGSASTPGKSDPLDEVGPADVADRLRERISIIRTNQIQLSGPLTRSAAERKSKIAEKLGNVLIDLDVRFRSDAGTPRYIKGDVLERAAENLPAGRERDEKTAQAFLRSQRALLRLKNPDQEMKLSRYQKDGSGRRHLRYYQTYRELPVWPAELIVHLDVEGNVDMMGGAFVPTPKEISIEPLLNAEAAIERAREAIPGESDAIKGDPEPIIYAPGNRPPRRAWKLEFSDALSSQWLVVIDALSGEVLTAYNQVLTENMHGSGADFFGVTQSLDVWKEGGAFYLVDTSKRMYDSTSNPPAVDSTRGAILVTDARNLPVDCTGSVLLHHVTSGSAASGWLPDAVSLAHNLSETYDYYLERHNRDSFDDNKSNIIGVVRLCPNFPNAFWQPDLSMMFFGDAKPYAGALDVVAHEFTHGVTQYTANLVYYNQSGALNEAFSDIFGEAVEAYSLGTADWINGGWLDSDGRSLKDPSSVEIIPGLGRFYPSTMSEFFEPNDPFLDICCIDRDNGGVHINMTIISHVFYLLAEGLEEAIGIEDAEQIFYRALAYYLPQNSQFIDARLSCISVAEELFGQGSLQALKTAEAFDTVEIFDDSETPEPPPLTPVVGPDATLYLYYDFTRLGYFLGRRENALGDGVKGVSLSQHEVSTRRPAVSGDGEFGIFVNAENDGCLIWTDGSYEECLGFPGQVDSIAMSPDGTLFSFVFLDAWGNRSNTIGMGNIETDEVWVFELVSPVIDADFSVANVLFAQTMDFTSDGRYLIYDALNSLELADGSEVKAWSIYAIDLETEQTIVLEPPVPGSEISNPAVSNTSNNRITYETHNEETGESIIYALNMNTRKRSVVARSPVLIGIPCYTGDDSAIVFSRIDLAADIVLSLWHQSLEGDRLTPMGDPSVFLNDAAFGVVYRRGPFDPPEANISATPDSLAFGATAVENTLDASITISNTGTADLRTNALAIAGTNTSQFSIVSGTCAGRTLTPSGTCTVNVAFSPTSGGAKSGTLVIESDDPNTPTLNVLLSGTGLGTSHTATDPATSVTSTSATLNGTVNSNGLTTTYHFEYGTTVSYGSTTPNASTGAGTSDVSVIADISGLDSGTTYHYRIVATNSAGTTHGADRLFATSTSGSGSGGGGGGCFIDTVANRFSW